MVRSTWWYTGRFDMSCLVLSCLVTVATVAQHTTVTLLSHRAPRVPKSGGRKVYSCFKVRTDQGVELDGVGVIG